MLVIENKIYHDQKNPFSEYEIYIQKNFKHKRPIYVVLSPGGKSVRDNWFPLSYGVFVQEIKLNMAKSIADNPYNKWFVFMRDFIINVEHYAVNSKMNEDAIEFIEKHYKHFVSMEKLRKEYIEHLRKEGVLVLEKLFPEQNFNTVLHSWNNEPAIRFYSNLWVGKSNLVLHVGDEGIRVHIYAYEVSESEIVDADKEIQKDYYEKPWTEQVSIRCYKSRNRVLSYREALNEFEEAAMSFNKFNCNRKSSIKVQQAT